MPSGDNMAKTAMINARTEQELKTEVEGILKTLGMSTAEAGVVLSCKFLMKKP
jgi:antitoxin component of RelBE/YafQ-DinJ toxin-antitoxin module